MGFRSFLQSRMSKDLRMKRERSRKSQEKKEKKEGTRGPSTFDCLFERRGGEEGLIQKKKRTRILRLHSLSLYWQEGGGGSRVASLTE